MYHISWIGTFFCECARRRFEWDEKRRDGKGVACLFFIDAASCAVRSRCGLASDLPGVVPFCGRRIDCLYVEQEVVADDTPAVIAVMKADKARQGSVHTRVALVAPLLSCADSVDVTGYGVDVTGAACVSRRRTTDMHKRQ